MRNLRSLFPDNPNNHNVYFFVKQKPPTRNPLNKSSFNPHLIPPSWSDPPHNWQDLKPSLLPDQRSQLLTIWSTTARATGIIEPHFMTRELRLLSFVMSFTNLKIKLKIKLNTPLRNKPVSKYEMTRSNLLSSLYLLELNPHPLQVNW